MIFKGDINYILNSLSMKNTFKNLSDFISGHDNLLIITFISRIIVLSMVIIAILISSEIYVPSGKLGSEIQSEKFRTSDKVLLYNFCTMYTFYLYFFCSYQFG